MKARFVVLLVALVVGGPVLAEQVHSIILGFVVFTWAVGVGAAARGSTSRA